MDGVVVVCSYGVVHFIGLSHPGNDLNSQINFYIYVLCLTEM
jgi:hypothetical protein